MASIILPRHPWTQENTIDHTDGQLAILNAAQLLLEEENPTVAPESIARILEQAWLAGVSPVQLVGTTNLAIRENASIMAGEGGLIFIKPQGE